MARVVTTLTSTRQDGMHDMSDDIDRAISKTDGDPVPTHFTGSFEHDVAPLRTDLYRHALRLTRNPADAEDLVQDTLFKAFRAYDRLRPNTFLKAWLVTIMKNTWISNYHVANRRPETLMSDVSDARFSTAAGFEALESCSAEWEVLRREMDPTLVKALNELSEEMRATVYHVVVEGMLCREVAELLGVSTNTVLTRMHRCKRALRRSLEETADGPGSGARQAA
jgi:RNA polymerase sigma-70 factor (ECF subfamily)